MKRIEDFYSTNRYIKENPTLHEEDSPWKVAKILPLVDIFLAESNKKKIKILDVGGGVGLILKEISKYIQSKGIIVENFALDLSPGMLKIQKKNNPGIKRLLNQDIRITSFKKQEIDLALMIDVLEHVPNPEQALKELNRIVKFVIFKVPLEANLSMNVSNLITFGKKRKRSVEKLGHINAYNINRLKKQIKENNFQILNFDYTDVFSYLLSSKYYFNEMTLKDKVANYLGKRLFRISPRLTSRILNDFTVILVKSN